MTKSANNWVDRKVTFVLSDHWHRLHHYELTLPVRARADLENGCHVYEAPLTTMWTLFQESYPQHAANRDLVGMLVCSLSKLDEGHISWLKPALNVFVEEGTDHLKEKWGKRQ